MANDATPPVKTCSRCGLTLRLDVFPLTSRGSTRRQAHCRDCKALYQREWYQRNRKRHIRNVAARNRRHRASNRALVEKAKDRPCADCGQRYPPCVMDFDHVRGEKLFNISEKVRTATQAALLDEITKCEVVCANCHRLRTYGPRAAGDSKPGCVHDDGGRRIPPSEEASASSVTCAGTHDISSAE